MGEWENDRSTVVRSSTMADERQGRNYLTVLLKKVDTRIADINDAIRLKQSEIDYLTKHL